MSMKLSIIVPLYNVEKYVEKCILSVIDSPLPKDDYEIIVINDGSTDSGPQIVEDIAKKHSNLILINIEHVGLTAARNVAFDRVRGEYVY